MRIRLMKTTLICAEWGSVMFALLAFGVLISMNGCASESEPQITIPVCEVPPSELDSTPCETEYGQCGTTEEKHPCCLGYSCDCLDVLPGPEQDLKWGCVHAGCADNAEECPGVCEVNPDAGFCPPPEE